MYNVYVIVDGKKKFRGCFASKKLAAKYARELRSYGYAVKIEQD